MIQFKSVSSEQVIHSEHSFMFQIFDLRAIDDLKLLPFPEAEIIFSTSLIIIESNK